MARACWGFECAGVRDRHTSGRSRVLCTTAPSHPKGRLLSIQAQAPPVLCNYDKAHFICKSRKPTTENKEIRFCSLEMPLFLWFSVCAGESNHKSTAFITKTRKGRRCIQKSCFSEVRLWLLAFQKSVLRIRNAGFGFWVSLLKARSAKSTSAICAFQKLLFIVLLASAFWLLVLLFAFVLFSFSPFHFRSSNHRTSSQMWQCWAK